MKKIFKKFLYYFNKWLLLPVGAIAIPIILIFLADESGSNKKSLTNLILNIGGEYLLLILGVLIIAARYIEIKYFEEEEWMDLRAQSYFLFIYARSAWLFGAAIASIFTFIYFLVSHPVSGLIPNNTFLSIPNNHFSTVFGIYVGVMAIVLGVHVLYRNMAPIIGTKLLLDRIYKDLKDVTHGIINPRIWFVYPALNIGFYRAEDNDENPWHHNRLKGSFNDGHIIGKIHNQLHDLFNPDRYGVTINPESCAITYPIDLYKDLYYVYHERKINVDFKINTEKSNEKLIKEYEEGDNPLVKSSVSSAEKLAKLFNKETDKIRLVEIDPDNFPQHVIIIGDIVYLIASYGLPIWDGKMFQPLKEKDVAYLITFRREDSNLANSIDNHLKTLIESIINCKKELSHEAK